MKNTRSCDLRPLVIVKEAVISRRCFIRSGVYRLPERSAHPLAIDPATNCGRLKNCSQRFSYARTLPVVDLDPLRLTFSIKLLSTSEFGHLREIPCVPTSSVAACAFPPVRHRTRCEGKRDEGPDGRRMDRTPSIHSCLVSAV